MLHLRNQIFEHGIRHVADEQIAFVVLGVEKLLIWIRGFRYHRGSIRVLGKDSGFQVWEGIIRGFEYSVKRFGVSSTELRGFRYLDSGF